MSYDQKLANEKLVADYDADDEIHDGPWLYWNVLLEAKEQRGEGEDTLSWTGLARSIVEAEALAIIFYWHEYDPYSDAQISDHHDW